MSLQTIAIDAFVQVRRGSTRLPDKAFARLGEATCIEHVVTRLKRCSMVRHVVVCTSDQPEDAALVAEATRLGVEAFRGNLSNCLERFRQCAKRFRTQIIVRVCGDSPLICPQLVDSGIKDFLEDDADYMGSHELPVGTYFEIFTVQALEKAARAALDPENSADLTYYVGRGEINRLADFDPPQEYARKDIVLALNRPEDLTVLAEVFAKAPRSSGCLSLREAIEFLDSDPQLRAHNAGYIPVSSPGVELDPSKLES